MKGEFALKHDPKKPNPYDLGLLTNISLFFDYDTFFWWFPSDKTTNNDGTSYPMRPPVKKFEIKEETGLLDKEIAKSFQELQDSYSDYYKNTTFVFGGKKYSLQKQANEIKKTKIE